jgi:hypothetical protein
MDHENRRLSRSNCATSDQRQVFNLSAVAQIPKFSGHMLQMIASNWQFSPIMKIKSGTFFSVTTGIDNALTGQTAILLPGVNPYASEKNARHWLNPAAFTSPAMGTYSPLGLYTFVSSAVFQLDMALLRTFAVGEKKTLQLQGEAFNLPNHMVPAAPGAPTSPLGPATPGATLNGGAFGQVQSDVLGPRIIQFALKYVF